MFRIKSLLPSLGSLLFLCLSPAQCTENSTAAREGKQGLFYVVNFPNEPCRGTNNYNGTCLSASECDGSGGQAMGSCANGFGICCFYYMRGCGGDVTKNQTYIQNQNFPDAYTVSADTTCEYKFYRINDNVCQIRLDFETFDLGPPKDPASSNFECTSTTTDYVVFTNAGGKGSLYNLCGYNPGQHVYIDMATPSASPAYATMSMTFDATNYASKERYYNIMASQIECNTNYYAPHGCDQYFFGNEGTGTIQAFNYDQPNSDYYARLTGFLHICVRREKGRCSIGYTPPSYESDPNGFAMNGNANNEFGRRSCSWPSGNSPPAISTCKYSYLRIPQGSGDGFAPYVSTQTPNIGCDRFCAKRLCLYMGATTSTTCVTDHNTIYSRKVPFTLNLESDSHQTANTGNKGYKLNYFQLPC